MSENTEQLNQVIVQKDHEIVNLVRAINGLDFDVEDEGLSSMVQEAIRTVRSQRHTVLILTAKQIMEAAEFAGLEVFAEPDSDELEHEYCIRNGTIQASPGEGLEAYTGYLIESAEYPEDGAVALSGEQPFVEYEPVIDDGFLHLAAKHNGWAGALAKRLLAVSAVGQWFVGADTGMSSKTMAAIFLGATAGDGGRFRYPLDPSDFARCWRLVDAIPAIRDAFPVMRQVYPALTPFIEHWDELSALYVAAVDSKTGKAPDLYQRMKELRAEIE